MERRLVWINLYGIPIELWSDACFRQITTTMGKFVGMDDATKDLTRTNRARILIKASLVTSVKYSNIIRINGHL